VRFHRERVLNVFRFSTLLNVSASLLRRKSRLGSRFKLNAQSHQSDC